MFTVLSSGLPISAKSLLNEAMDKAFDGAVDIQELTKDQLRSRVRLSSRNVEVVLVVLDGVSSDLCSDIENGLYKSDKYFTYTTDREFADFLNAKYGLDLVVEEIEVEEVQEQDSNVSRDELEDLERVYQEKLSFKDKTIKNLECRIRDLTELYGEVDENIETINSEIEEKLRDENIKLSNDLLTSEATIKELKDKVSELEALKEEKINLENRIKTVSKNYDEVMSELNELKVSYSRQSGVIRDKEIKIEELQKGLLDWGKDKEKISELESLIGGYKKIIQDKEAEIGDLKIDLESKEKEVSRYITEVESLRGLEGISEELDCANSTIGSLKEEVNTLSSEKSNLSKSLNEKERVINQLSDSNIEKDGVITELMGKVESLSERVKSDDISLAKLNKEKLELQSKLNVFENSSTDKDGIDELLKEVQDLQNRLAAANSNIFTRIGLSALPNSCIGAKVINGKGRFENIRFAYSGSAESRKGAYKCLLEELRESKSEERYLIVDLVSETSVDYVFEIKKLVPGIDWFRKGGSVQPYISDTALRNTKVLSVGLGYINDSYFLCIDWLKRLSELNSSGYKVILFCGDISNMVGRVLHESFSSYGESSIYVMGNSIGARTIITNLRGLSNAKESVVVYYDYNEAIKRFYDIVAKTNECKIVSTRSSIRR